MLMRAQVIIPAVLLLLSTQAVAGNKCGVKKNTFPEIIPCPEVREFTERPRCDASIPIHRVYGYLSYHHFFLEPNPRPCGEFPFLHLPAKIEVAEDLEMCLEFPCDPNGEVPCKHEVLIYPYFLQTQTAARNIARQERCERRRFMARGCFVEGTGGRLFVADYIGFDLVKEGTEAE